MTSDDPVIWMTQCYLPPDTSERALPNPSHRLVLDLPTPEGLKAELTYLMSFHVRPLLADAYTAASAGCPVARRVRVTSVPVKVKVVYSC